MLRPSTEPKPQDKMEIADKQKNGLQQNFFLLNFLPDDIWLIICAYYLSSKETAPLALVNKQLYGLFQSEIGKTIIKAKHAAECAIYPTKENVEKLITSLSVCPMVLHHPVMVKNRHGTEIKGTVYQVTLHEDDNELIDDVIEPAFKKLDRGLETMEAQRKAWLSEGWMEAEEKACANALTAIDNVFTALKNAGPNDVTELQQYPYTITINNQEVNKALDACRKAIDALYKPTGKVIESGRDPTVRLIERFIDRYEENYVALGGDNAPRNNALMRAVFGYGQRHAPINFMQAFAMGIYYLIKNKEKLIRSFEYRNWREHFILPLDSDPHFRLGYEHFAGRLGWASAASRVVGCLQDFLSIKNSSYTNQNYVQLNPR